MTNKIFVFMALPSNGKGCFIAAHGVPGLMSGNRFYALVRTVYSPDSGEMI